MNFETLFNKVISEAMQDADELIPSHELPSAKIITDRIEKLESALYDILAAHVNDNIRPRAFYIAAKTLDTL